MAGFGKSHDRRHRSYERMRRLRGPGVISRSICKSHDAAICMIGHFTRDRQMRGWGHFTHFRRLSQMFSQTLCNFSKFLSACNYTICDWSKTLILKQLHFSFFLANHIKTKLCDMKNVCKENPVGLSTTSRDASVGLCRKLYFSKYKYPFESDETFITEFGSQGLAG